MNNNIDKTVNKEKSNATALLTPYFNLWQMGAIAISFTIITFR